MTTKPIDNTPPSQFRAGTVGKTNTRTDLTCVTVFERSKNRQMASPTEQVDLGGRALSPCPPDAAPLRIPAPQIPRPPSSFSDSDEILREMGRKTFHYKNPITPDEAVDWKEKTNRELTIVAKKASMLAVVNLMDEKIEGSLALEIVNETSLSQKSLLDVYMEKGGRNHSFFHCLAARLKYFFYFRCNIVPNTLNIFMQNFLDKMRSELVQKDGGKNITALINTLLGETSSFLDYYLQATDNYAKGINLHGSRDAHINYELTQKLGMSIGSICHKFALTSVREFLPHVPFFQHWQNSSWRLIRITGFILDHTLGWVLNRILRKSLEVKIPSILQSIVKTSIDATQPSNLPFVVAITQGILEQLRKFKTQLEQTQDSPTQTPFAAIGTEKLPEVVKKLIEVLGQEPQVTRKELQQPINNSSFNPLSPEIDKRIEEGCIDGSREFLNFLSKPSNSEEIFYLLLNLVNTTFEKPQDLKKLQGDYEALKIQMRREAREVFRMVIHRSVNERLHGMPESHLQQLTTDFEKSSAPAPSIRFSSY